MCFILRTSRFARLLGPRLRRIARPTGVGLLPVFDELLGSPTSSNDLPSVPSGYLLDLASSARLLEQEFGSLLSLAVDGLDGERSRAGSGIENDRRPAAGIRDA